MEKYEIIQQWQAGKSVAPEVLLPYIIQHHVENGTGRYIHIADVGVNALNGNTLDTEIQDRMTHDLAAAVNTFTEQEQIEYKNTRFELKQTLTHQNGTFEPGTRGYATVGSNLQTADLRYSDEFEGERYTIIRYRTVELTIPNITTGIKDTVIVPSLLLDHYVTILEKTKKETQKIKITNSETQFTVGNVTIDKNTEVNQEFVPKNVQTIITEPDKLQVIAHCINQSRPVLLVGETGTGKTALIEYLAHVTNNSFIRLNLDGATTKDEFVGKWLVNNEGTYWVDGILTKAMKNGYWLLLDEINAALPEITMVLHSVLEPGGKLLLSDKNGEIITPHQNFRVFGTCNPDSYAGTKEFNLAFLSRFEAVVDVNYLDIKNETELLVNRTAVNSDIAFTLATIAKHLRTAKDRQAIMYPCSTRDLLACATYYNVVQDLSEAVKYTIASKMQVESDKTLLNDLLLLYV